MITVEEKYMSRCLALARQGLGKVRPNPMVGSVLVYDGQIIGEGYHRKHGETHAEVNAIAAVKDESLLRKSTLYVNLEPCSHYGKTPPCAELIIRKQIPRVVIGCLDPYPEVSGRGVRMLLDAGIEVITDIMKKEAFALNKMFMTSHILKRPYVYLKWAQSADGYLDRKRKDASELPITFSSPLMLQQVHKKRSEVAAIMVGTRTALLDDPSLTVRYWAGDSPVRIVLDKELRIPPHYHLLEDSVQTVVFTAIPKENTKNVTYIQTDFGKPVLMQVLSYLYKNKLTSLLVEGGSYLLKSFLQEGVWDEMQIETTPTVLGDGIEAPVIDPLYYASLESAVTEGEENINGHVITVYSRKNTLFK